MQAGQCTCRHHPLASQTWGPHTTQRKDHEGKPGMKKGKQKSVMSDEKRWEDRNRRRVKRGVLQLRVYPAPGKTVSSRLWWRSTRGPWHATQATGCVNTKSWVCVCVCVCVCVLCLSREWVCVCVCLSVCLSVTHDSCWIDTPQQILLEERVNVRVQRFPPRCVCLLIAKMWHSAKSASISLHPSDRLWNIKDSASFQSIFSVGPTRRCWKHLVANSFNRM